MDPDPTHVLLLPMDCFHHPACRRAYVRKIAVSGLKVQLYDSDNDSINEEENELEVHTSRERIYTCKLNNSPLRPIVRSDELEDEYDNDDVIIAPIVIKPVERNLFQTTELKPNADEPVEGDLGERGEDRPQKLVSNSAGITDPVLPELGPSGINLETSPSEFVQESCNINILNTQDDVSSSDLVEGNLSNDCSSDSGDLFEELFDDADSADDNDSVWEGSSKSYSRMDNVDCAGRDRALRSGRRSFCTSHASGAIAKIYEPSSGTANQNSENKTESVQIRSSNEENIHVHTNISSKCGSGRVTQKRTRRNKNEMPKSDEKICKVCGKSVMNLRNHMKSLHMNVRPYGCKICGQLFKQGVSLSNHMRIHSGEKPAAFPSKICAKPITKSREYSHMKLHQDERSRKEYRCDVCKKVFKAKAHLRTHMFIHSDSFPCVCDICGKGFNQHAPLVVHRRIHTGERPFKCQHCEKAFQCKTNLDAHTRTHTGEKPYVCKVCKKAFSDQGACKRHQRVHTGERPFKCKHCRAHFNDTGARTRHERLHTGEKPYKCNVCDERFIVSENLKKHMCTAHGGERPYKCNLCEKSYLDSGNLKIHQRTHSKDSLFTCICHICGKQFPSKANLSNHVTGPAHGKFGSTIYSCEICGREYSSNINLNKHRKTHKTTDKVKCDLCDKIFSCKRTLQRHLQGPVHNSEAVKNHVCSTCSKGFFSKGMLTRHLSVHKRPQRPHLM